jgi:hypothetical protein
MYGKKGIVAVLAILNTGMQILFLKRSAGRR